MKQRISEYLTPERSRSLLPPVGLAIGALGVLAAKTGLSLYFMLFGATIVLGVVLLRIRASE